jgi:hypothetical protein
MIFENSDTAFNFLPAMHRSNVQMFLPNSNAATQWQRWRKPKGVTMVHMLCIGGGAGGGGGQSAAGNKGGGGGGASGTIASIIIPAIFLPDSLWVIAGAGGKGGAAATNGTAGLGSYISLSSGVTAGTSIPNIILFANGGIQGTSANPGGAGSAPAVTTIAACGPLAKLGFIPNLGNAANASITGLAGTAGGSSTLPYTPGVTTGAWNVLPITGGTGGGGGTNAASGPGGTITLQAATDFEGGGTYLALNTLTAGNPVGGLDGNNGIRSLKPFLNTGGTGGAGSPSGTGGKGGDGGYASGGGGGGAGVTGGRGGNGGDGIVIITCW